MNLKFRLVVFAVLVTVLTLWLTSAGAAQTTDISNAGINLTGLSDSQIAELVLQAESMKEEAASQTNQVINVEQLNQYAEFGQAFGSAISQTASEVGQATNEFIQTPAGKIAIMLIVWKIAGEELFGAISGFVWFTVMIPLWIYFWHTTVTKNRWEYQIRTDAEGKEIVDKIPAPDPLQSRADVASILMMITFMLICISGFVMVF